MKPLGLALSGMLLWAIPVAAGANGSLLGRIVTLRVLTYDDRDAPFFDGTGATVKVGPQVEFGLDLEGAQNGLDVVPVQVNISAKRIELSYAGTEPGGFALATFNGYELRFDTDCALFAGAHIDPAATTLPIDDSALSTDHGALYVNVAGLAYDRGSHIAIDLSVMDCPMS